MRTLGALLFNCVSFFLLAPHFALAQVPAAIASAPPPAKLPPKGSPHRIKQLSMYAGTDTAYKLARKYNIKTAWGIDILYQCRQLRRSDETTVEDGPLVCARRNSENGHCRQCWIARAVGERSPYQGKLGVIDVGALADIKLLEDADKNLAVIMKDGKITRSRPRGRRLAARLHANSLSRKRPQSPAAAFQLRSTAESATTCCWPYRERCSG
jgi:hypothetical protein